jgi:hypothetical protein
MDLDILKENLRSWMQHETWHSNHPTDYKRFHRALESAFDEIGVAVDYDDFKEVIHELAEELYSNYETNHRETLVEKFASRADTISGYLSDVST